MQVVQYYGTRISYAAGREGRGVRFGTDRQPRCSAGGIGIAIKPSSEWSFIYPVGRSWWAKNVAMPGGVGSNPDRVPTRKGTKILRACAVAVTRDSSVTPPSPAFLWSQKLGPELSPIVQ